MLTSQPIKDFISTARAYCMFVETDLGHDPRQFLRTVQKDLLTLYRMGLDLPDITPAGEVLAEANDHKIHIDRVRRLITDHLPFNRYWNALNMLQVNEPTQVGTGDLIDDLAAIYLDLKRGLLLFDAHDGSTKEEAIWELRFGYEQHWGNRCMDALHVIHRYLIGKN